jgi:hypothetical protein
MLKYVMLKICSKKNFSEQNQDLIEGFPIKSLNNAHVRNIILNIFLKLKLI